MENIAPEINETNDSSTSSASVVPSQQLSAPSCVATFNSTVMDLVAELKGTFPELNDILDEKYTALSPTDTSVMEWFEANAKEHHTALTAKEASVFKENRSLFLLPDINFSQLWKCKLTRSNKNAIWKYLHVLLLLVSHNNMQKTTQSLATTVADDGRSENCVSDDTSLSDSMKSTFEQWNKMLDNKDLAPDELKAMKEQSEKMMTLMATLHGSNDNGDEGEGDDDEDDSHSGQAKQPTMEDIKNDPFVRQLENSKIAQFAKELTEEIDMSDLGLSEKDEGAESFQDVFNMMGKDPQKMFGLVKSVGDKIQSKMQSGDIQQSELLGEAQQLMQSMQTSDTFKQMFKGKRKKGKGKGKGKGADFDPHTMFQEMTKHINPEMMQQAMAMMGNMQGMPGMPPMPGQGSTTATRARLQQKVASKAQREEHAPPQTQPVSTTPPQNTNTNANLKKKKKKKKKTNTNTTTPVVESNV